MRSRDYQASQDCMCDGEHMFDCPGSKDPNNPNREMRPDLESFLARQFGVAKKSYNFNNVSCNGWCVWTYLTNAIILLDRIKIHFWPAKNYQLPRKRDTTTTNCITLPE